MKIDYILPYSLKSESAMRMAAALSVPPIDHNSNKVLGGPGVTVLNWGYGSPNHVLRDGTRIINDWKGIAAVVDKRKTFEIVGREYSVPFTRLRPTAQEWIRDGHTVVCRKTVSGRDGQGIVIAKPQEELDMALLYTKFVQPEEVYRVHVMRKGPQRNEANSYNVITWARMARKYKEDGTLPPHNHVRSYSNGYVFSTNGRPLCQKGKDLSKAVAARIGLDFTALDIVYDGTRYYFLEANSAPGIERRDVEHYVKGFNDMEYST